MNLRHDIKRILREETIMNEGKDAYVSRARYDQEYEEEYPKWGKTLIKLIGMDIDSYTEVNNDTIIILFNKNTQKNLIKYDKRNEQLWYSNSLMNDLMSYIPYGYLSRHFKYAVQDYFKKHFPQYGVREINSANFG
jgi:hypothetical protein